MNTNCTSKTQITPRIIFMTCLTAFTLALSVSLPQEAHAHPKIEVPPVPSTLQPPEGHKTFLVGHAVGTQQYFCKYSSAGFAWTQFGPQATLLRKNGKAFMTHFQSSNPDEDPDYQIETGKARPTWQNSHDASAVWGALVPGAVFSPSPDAIPWLLLEVVGNQPGPSGGNALGRATFIQRLNTTGGLAPTTGCAAEIDIGKKVLVPYTADYVFYDAVESDADDD